MEEEAIDPRIKDELECLNSASEKINQLENEISKKRQLYRTALSESTQQLNHLTQDLGDCVAKARPYYEARRLAKEALQETQQAALNFERAVSMHSAAHEMVSVAEQGMLRDCNSRDTAWPEMLNHATIKVNEAEMDRFTSELEHKRKAEAYKVAEKALNKLERKLKSSIQKSRPYFEAKQKAQDTLEEHSEAVHLVETQLQEAKGLYSSALQKLEEISNHIHAARNALRRHSSMLGQREQGVGAETVPTIEIDECGEESGFDDSSSMQMVLKDLQHDDSVAHLSVLLNSCGLDSISCNSAESIASSGSGFSTNNPEDTIIFSASSNKTFKHDATVEKMYEGVLPVEETRKVEGASHSLERGQSLTHSDTGDDSGIDDAVMTRKGSVASSSTRNSTLANDGCASPSTNSHSEEVVLTIAGLGEVSSSS